MKRYKELLFSFLALSIIGNAGQNSNNYSEKYEKLYNEMTKNLSTGKSNNKIYETLENILKKRNAEQQDLYLQGDYIIKPEYLEWQVFFSGFYNSRNSSFSKNDGNDYSYNKAPRSLNLGMYIPMQSVDDVSAPTTIQNTDLAMNSLAPNVPTARNGNSFSALKPDVNVNINPFSLSININDTESDKVNLQSGLTPFSTVLDTVDIFNLQLNPLSTSYYGSYWGVNFAVTLPEDSSADIIYKVNDIWNNNNVLVNNGNVESRIRKKNAAAFLIERGLGYVGTYGNFSNINLENSNTGGAVMQPYTGGITSFDKTTEYALINAHYYYGGGENSIVGQTYSTSLGLLSSPANGVFTKQIGMGYIPTGTAQNVQVRMENYAEITMKSPNSAGFLLMPDIDADPGIEPVVTPGSAIPTYDSGGTKFAYISSNADQSNVRQRALNASTGVINIYGSRSYGFMTSPYGGNDASNYNFGISTEALNTSSISNQGIINVLGDESTGFAIKKSIHLWSNEGTINVGNNDPLFEQNVANGNTVYDENGNPGIVGNPAFVERATGMYTNQPLISFAQSYNPLPVFSTDMIFGLAENSAHIILWHNAAQSSGLRAENKGYVLNRGDITIYGKGNYGMVVIDDNSYVYNITYTGDNIVSPIPGNDTYVPSLLGREAVILVEPTAVTSVGGFVKNGGNLENASLIKVTSANSAGLYIRSGAAINSDRTNQPKNHNYGQIVTKAANTHSVILTNEDEKGATLINKGLIETDMEGTIAVYAVNGSKVEISNLNELESHYIALNTPVTTDYAQNASVRTRDGGTALWLEQSNSVFSVTNPAILPVTSALVAAPIIIRDSTTAYTSLGVYSDSIATAEFKKGTKYDLNPSLYINDVAAVRTGTDAVALLQNYMPNKSDSRAKVDFAGSGGVFDIKSLEIKLGDNSVMAYSNGGKITTSILGGIFFSGLGNNTILTFASNNGSIIIDDTKLADFLTAPGSVSVGTGTMPFMAENGTVENTVISGTEGLILNTAVGIKAYSKEGTSVAVSPVNTNVINSGILTMKNNSGGASALNVKYGVATNDGTVVLHDNNSVGIYVIEKSQAVNNGTVTAKGNTSAGIYALSDDTGSNPITGASGIDIKNLGVINTEGSGSAGIYARYNDTLPVPGANQYLINNSGTINVKNIESVGIYADNTGVLGGGTINLHDISLLGATPSGNRIGVYATGSNAQISGGGTINLGTVDQTNIAYYLTNGALLRSSLGTVTGYGVLIYADNDIDNSTPLITASDGQIALALKNGAGLTYTQDIRTGDTVNTGTEKFYAVALHTNKQTGTLANNLYAGAEGIGLYASGGTGVIGSGSILTYNGHIEVGDGTAAGIGIYVDKGSNVNVNSGSILLDGAGGIGAYVENAGEFTFGSGSSMTFTDSGIGIWGENGSVINDNGGYIGSSNPSAVIIRSRIGNGVINITGPVTNIGNGMGGYVAAGEINNLSGSSIITNSSVSGSVGIAAEDYKAVGSNPYEANNFGIIDLANATDATGISVKNARAYNDTNALIKVGTSGIGIYGQGDSVSDFTELRNNGTIIIDYSNSVGLYGEGASLIENNNTISGSASGVGNIGIYERRVISFPVTTTIKNNAVITLGDNGTGIYGEDSDITNNGSITVGNSQGTAYYPVGIYGVNSTVTNNGDVSIGNGGIAFVGDNTVINLNGGNIDDAKGSLVFVQNSSVVNYNLGDRTTGVNPYINLADSTINFSAPVKISVINNGTGVFASGLLSAINGSLSLDIADNANGLYLQDTSLYVNNGTINVNGQNSKGISAENTDVTNASEINVNGTEAAGIYSGVTVSGASSNVNNTGKINVNSDNGKGIYATGVDSSSTVLGNIIVDNNGEINLGTSPSKTQAKVGIYGDKAVTINNNGDVLGGSNVTGIYSNGGNITQNGKIHLGDASTGIYLSGGTLYLSSGSEISMGNNRAAGVFAVAGAVIINDSSNISTENDGIMFYLKDNGSKLINNANLNVSDKSTAFYTDDSEVSNLGDISVSGPESVIFYGLSSKIVNTGKLDAQGNSGVVGIYSKDSDVGNAGDIILGDSIIRSASDPVQNSYAVGIYGDNSLIKNNAKIILGESAVGIYSKNNINAAVNIGIIESSKNNAIGMFGENAALQNDGQIILNGDNSIGMAGRVNSTLTNNGTIVINGNYGIGIYAAASSTVENNNIIELKGSNSIGILLEPGSILVNSGTINLYGNATNIDIKSDAGTPADLPSIINAGVINVEEKFEINGVQLSIKVDPSTVRKPTMSEITGENYETGDISAKFLISNAVQFHAKSFSINEPINIMSDFSQGTNSTAYKLENVFNPTTSYGGPNGGNLSVISGSLTWDAIPVVNSLGNVDIWMKKLDYTQFANGKWFYDFAAGLDSRYEDATGDALKIYDKIDRIRSEKDFNRIIEGLGGNIYANMNQREEDIADIFENSLALLKDSANNTKENVKIDIITGAGKTGEKADGVPSYDYKSVGILALREVERTYKHTFGYSLGYLHTGFDFDDNNDSEELADTLQLGVHNKYVTNGWKFINDFTGRVSFHNTDRNIDWEAGDGRSEMNGTYEAYSITSDNIIGREMELGKNASITPYGALKGIYVVRPGFSENGLEALEVDGNDAWSIRPRAGVALKASLPLGPRTAWKLKGALDIFYEYELADLNKQESARLLSIEEDYHNLAKPDQDYGRFKTRAAIGAELADRYGIFLTGDYAVNGSEKDEYRAGIDLKVVF